VPENVEVGKHDTFALIMAPTRYFIYAIYFYSIVC
jgi:hypothetical protein